MVATHSKPVCMVDDLNIQVDCVDDVNAVSLRYQLSSYGFNNCLTAPIHRLSGMLDVVAMRQDLIAPDVVVDRPQFTAVVCLFWSPHAGCLWRSLDINDFWSAVLSALV